MIIKNELAKNLCIYQCTDTNNYTNDSILLTNFLEINKKTEKILDLCCGNGIISLLVSQKVDKHIIGIDIQKENIDLFNQSISENKLNNQINAICADVKNLSGIVPFNSWDLIVCNPPFFKCFEETKYNKIEAKKIARHESMLSFEELIKSVKQLLSNKGKFCFIHTADRFDELIKIIHKYNFTISRLQIIYTKENQDAKRFLLEIVKNNNTHTKILPPIVIN